MINPIYTCPIDLVHYQDQNTQKDCVKVNLYHDDLIMVSDLDERAKILESCSKETQDFILEKLKNLNINSSSILPTKEEIEYFLNNLVPEKINHLIKLIDEINFSRNYQNSFFSYPSNEDLRLLVTDTLSLRDDLRKFCKIQEVLEKFDIQFDRFLQAIKSKICRQAYQSRLAQQEAILQGKLIVEDRDFQLACIKHHLIACIEQENYCWLELRNLLNLQAKPEYNRKHTHKEMDFFKFITRIYDRLFDKLKKAE